MALLKWSWARTEKPPKPQRVRSSEHLEVGYDFSVRQGYWASPHAAKIYAASARLVGGAVTGFVKSLKYSVRGQDSEGYTMVTSEKSREGWYREE